MSKKAELDYSVIDTALFYGATIKQVLFLLKSKGIHICQRTLLRDIEREKDKTFKEYRDDQTAGLRFQLIQKAVKKALNGDNTMLIFCLKNMCGWSDKRDIAHSGNELAPIKLVYSQREKKECDKESTTT